MLPFERLSQVLLGGEAAEEAVVQRGWAVSGPHPSSHSGAPSLQGCLQPYSGGHARLVVKGERKVQQSKPQRKGRPNLFQKLKKKRIKNFKTKQQEKIL